MASRNVLRIAHAHGNRRRRIEQALAAGVDMIEADLRFDGSRIWVRHELRAPLLPLLYNGRINRFHREGPWAVYIARAFMRLDIAPISFDELLDRSHGVGLMLDLKRGRYSGAEKRRFIETTFGILDRWHHGPIGFCGSWQLLDSVREVRPDQTLYYSVDDSSGWRALEARVVATPPRAITIQARMLDDEREATLRRLGLEYIVWDVERPEQAADAIRRGASGIISHHLDVLGDLPPAAREQHLSV